MTERSATEEMEEIAAEAGADPTDQAPASPPVTMEAAQEHEEPDYESEARAKGWKPETEWKGDKARWVDAKTFLDAAEFMPGTIHRLKTTVERQEAALREAEEARKRIEATFSEASRRERERHAAELAAVRAEREAARKDFDFERYDAATQREQTLTASAPKAEPPSPAAKQYPPETQEWIARNPWFIEDEGKRGEAMRLADEAHRAGLTDVKAQLAYVERKMATAPAASDPPRRPVAAVESAPSLPGKRSKGWDDIPASDRELATRNGLIGPKSPFKDHGDYAASYWSM